MQRRGQGAAFLLCSAERPGEVRGSIHKPSEPREREARARNRQRKGSRRRKAPMAFMGAAGFDEVGLRSRLVLLGGGAGREGREAHRVEMVQTPRQLDEKVPKLRLPPPAAPALLGSAGFCSDDDCENQIH